MELLKNLLVDFCLFSFIEGFIFCLFFEKIGGFRKFKLNEILILSLGNCIISQTFPPLIYQIIILFYMSFVLKLFDKENKINYCIKISFLSIIFMLIIEMPFAMFYEFVFNIDFSMLSSFNKILLILPMRIIQFLIIFIKEK